MITRYFNTISITTMYENYMLEKYGYNASCEKEIEWDKHKQILFIDSILKNFPIPLIFLRQMIDTTGKILYEIIDGKQRIYTILTFLNNKLEVNSKVFDDLPTEERRKFWLYKIPIVYIETESIDLIKEFMNRINTK